MKFRSIVPLLILILAVVGFVAPANAQITITGPSNGFCSSNPAVPIGTANLVEGSFKYVPYGAGQLATSTCQLDNDTKNAILLFPDPATVLPTLANGIDITGAGNLQGLLVKIGSGIGGDVDITVWVLHNAVATQTPFVCHIAGGVLATPSAPLKCEDSTTIVPVASTC